MITKLNIVCYKWGNLYDSAYVNILFASVKRNLSVPFDFYCLTDDATGLNPNIIARSFPSEALIGNGAKLYTFSANFLGLTSEDYVVSLDLDVVIVGSLEFLLEKPEHDFIIAPHRYRRANSRGHGAVYRLRVNSHTQIWNNFISDPIACGKQFAVRTGGGRLSEQRWLENCLPGKKMKFFTEGKVIIFRVDCASRSWTWRLGEAASRMGITFASYGKARLPGANEAIVSFSGPVNPLDVKEAHCGHYRHTPFVSQYWRL